ncbi:MAG: YceI family protein [Cytophagales bacterium]|nr:YceI family protein [Cytophagales bacterium]
MKKQILFSAIAIVAIAFSAFTAKENQSTLSVNTAESKVTWLGKKVTGQHTGTIEIAVGKLEFNNDKLSGGSFEIDMNSIKNTDLESEEYNQKLVGHLKSDDFFGVAKYPKSTFTITNVRQKSANKYHVTGDITIKATTKSIEFPVEISMSGNKAVASASITIDRSEFDVRYGSGSFFDGLGDKMIYDDFTLDITLVANK